MTQPLFLIGPRGCGKTTVGMALADSLNRRFVDTDQWLQSQLNMTVAEIVEREEWAGFRAQRNGGTGSGNCAIPPLSPRAAALF
ncbi:shikimate kinase [Escherichia coli]|uniref:Shikimate kinase n=1 Tax=Escherichia coli TaxID=562 RepID=A0A376MS20_ECOLX|nr:shikimate kinase [Escherichia coli]